MGSERWTAYRRGDFHMEEAVDTTNRQPGTRDAGGRQAETDKPTGGGRAADPRTVRQVATREKIRFAREQRHEPTQMEDHLWRLLRGDKTGVKFRRQHPVQDFVLDFYCPAAKLAIEIDGPHHERQTKYDEWRDECLGKMGIQVLRLAEPEVFVNPRQALAGIVAACRGRIVSQEQ